VLTSPPFLAEIAEAATRGATPPGKVAPLVACRRCRRLHNSTRTALDIDAVVDEVLAVWPGKGFPPTAPRLIPASAGGSALHGWNAVFPKRLERQEAARSAKLEAGPQRLRHYMTESFASCSKKPGQPADPAGADPDRNGGCRHARRGDRERRTQVRGGHPGRTVKSESGRARRRASATRSRSRSTPSKTVPAPRACPREGQARPHLDAPRDRLRERRGRQRHHQRRVKGGFTVEIEFVRCLPSRPRWWMSGRYATRPTSRASRSNSRSSSSTKKRNNVWCRAAPWWSRSTARALRHWLDNLKEGDVVQGRGEEPHRLRRVRRPRRHRRPAAHHRHGLDSASSIRPRGSRSDRDRRPHPQSFDRSERPAACRWASSSSARTRGRTCPPLPRPTRGCRPRVTKHRRLRLLRGDRGGRRGLVHVSEMTGPTRNVQRRQVVHHRAEKSTVMAA